MKILIISLSTYRRHLGIASVVRNLYINDIFKKEDITFLIYSNTEKPMIEELNNNGYKVVLSEYRLKHPIKYFFFLYKLMKKEHYDIVHVHGNSALSVIDLLPAKLAGIKVRIMHSHSSSCSHMKLHSLLKPYFNTLCNVRYACTQDAGNFLFGKNEFIILKNGIDETRYIFNQNKRNELRKQYGFEDKIIVGHIGTLNENKNQSFLIKLFYEYLKTKKNAILYLIGEGKLRTDLTKLVEELQIQDKVFMEGIKNDANEDLNMFDYFIFPSLHEGFGLSPAEAQVNGLPVLISDTVPMEVKINDNVYFMSLKDGVDCWNEKLLSLNMQRCPFSEEKFKKAGLCLQEIVSKLYDDYKNLVNH